MILTDQERERFASWLEELADGNRQLVGQLERIHQDAMAQNLKQEIVAAVLISRRLRSTEVDHVGTERRVDG